MLGKGPIDLSSQGPEQSLIASQNGSWQVSEGFALFEAEFDRSGFDLLIQDPSGTILRLPDYFLSDTPADVLHHNGANLAGHVVERLAGPLFPGQYAQTGGFDLADAIGQVETLTGTAFAQRSDGTVVELEIGTKVFQGDVVRTEDGGTLSLTFLDGTIFTLASASRMVLDELIYDPQGSENSGVFNLVQGGFVFIAGEVAGTGGIDINTPAATMGIRGTTILIDIQSTDGIATVSVSLNPDPDGGTGEIELFDLNGNLISTITTTDTKWIISPPFTNEPPIEVERTQGDFNEDAPLLLLAVAAFQSAITRVENGQTFVDLPATVIEDEVDAPEGDTGETPTDPEPVQPTPLDDGPADEEDSESGTDNQELDGEDDPVPDADAPPPTEDDAQITPPTGGTEVASNPVNRPPEFASDPIQSVEDTPFTGTIPVTDQEGDAIEVTLTRGAENGLVVLARDGTFTYTPNPDFEGTDTFIVSAQDSEGAVTESEVTVAVNPVNDAPVVSISTADATAQEAGVNAGPEGGQASGQIAYADVDEADTPATWSIAPSDDNTTAFGVATIDPATGDWTYALDQAAADVLAQDENVVETFLATVTDAEGATDTTTLRVTVTGTNDGPVVTSGPDQATATMSEAMTGFDTLSPGTPSDPSAPAGSVGGTLSFNDVDQGNAAAQWSVSANPANATQLGSLQIDAASGVWVYTLDEGAADVLRNGDVVTETFNAVVTDDFGATASQTISVTVTGLNDAPTIAFSIEDIEATVTEDGFVAGEGGGALPAALPAMEVSEADATGTLRYVDPDGQASDVATWSVVPDGPSLGEMTIDALTGTWHYFLDEAAAQGLRDGEEVIETFTATVTDNLGAASTQTITITVLGANDASEIVVQPGDVQGDVAEGGQSTAGGTLSYVDPEAQAGEVSTWSITPASSPFGSITIDANTGEWLYLLDQAQADVLAEGEQIDDLFTATLTDPIGATSHQVITVTITGENDAPVIKATDISVTVKEAGAGTSGTPSATGTLIADDPDQGGTASFWTISPDGTNATTFGTMQIDAVSGTWTYTLDQSAAQLLDAGDNVVERFNATVTDAFGATDTRVVEIDILGTNDAPQVSAGTAAVTEGDAFVSVDLGALVSDPDVGNGGSFTFALAGAPGGGSARIDGANLIFEPGNDFDDLASGATRVVDVDFTATDAGGASTGGTVTVTVTGINSSPTFALNAEGSVFENAANLTLSLAAFGDDPDTGQDGGDLSYELLGSPSAGSARISGTSLIFEPGNDFTDLVNGETADVLLAIRATDPGGLSTTGTVRITVTGTNAAPTLAGTSISVDADGPSATISLALLGDDPDPGEDGTTLTYDIISGPGAGIAQITGTTLIYDPNGAFDDLGQDETDTLTIGLRATDAEGLSATSTLTITINGNNDGPVITTIAADSAGATQEAGATTSGLATASGTLTYSDVDEGSPNEGTWTISPLGSPLGSMSIGPATGTWTYTLDAAASDPLNEGEIRTEIFTATVTDVAGASASQTVTITITGTNDAPQLAAATAEIDADGGSVQINLDATDVDSADTPATLQFAILRGPSGGSLTLANGVLEFSVGSDFDDLPDQETETVTFDISVTDSTGASSVTEMSVVVTGTQTAPVITSTAADALGDVTETSGTGQTAATTGGTLTYDDPDAATPTSGVWTIAGASALGEIEIDPTTGVWLYTLDTALSDGLNNGEERIETFTATITDADDLTATQVITVTITGANDAPTLASATTSILEDATTAASVNLTALASDPDAADTAGSLTFALSGNPTEGTATVSGGTLQFFTNGDFEDLAQGEVRSAFVDVEVSDGGGGSQITTFRFDVTGTNDAPVINVANSDINGAAKEVGVGTASSTAPDATGTLDYDDVDEQAGALGTWSISSIGTSFGTMQINATTGAWTFFLDHDLVDGMREGAVIQDRYTAVVTDAEWATASQVVTIVITGTNDQPVVNVADSVTQGGYVTGNPLTISGLLEADDPDDVVAAPTWQIAGAVGASSDNYGSMSINASTGQWTYVTDPAKAAALAEGAVAFEEYVATITDEFGASSSVDVTISITGTNEAPTVSGTTAARELNVVEEGAATAGVPTASGQLTYVDVDEGPTTGLWTINPTGPTTYGSVSINPLTGLWTYTLDQTKANSLNDGQIVTETFQATYTDFLFAASDPLGVQVTITGSNDAPILTPQTASITQDGTATINLRNFATDIDAEHDPVDLTFNVTPPALGDAQISPLGVFTFDPLSDFDYLAVDETAQIIVDVTVSDPVPATSTSRVTVTVTGTNDAPEVIIGAPLHDVSETLTETDATLTTSGTFRVADADVTDVVSVTGITLLASGELGSSVAANDPTLLAMLSTVATQIVDGSMTEGQVNWNFASGSANFDYLRATQSLTLTYTIAIGDDAATPGTTTQEVVITIEGTNDGPLITTATGENEGAVVEAENNFNASSTFDPGTPSTGGTLSASDPDGIANPTWTIVTAGAYGTFAINATSGAWTYDLDNSAAQSLNEGQMVTDQVLATALDDSGATTTQTVTVSITGTNDRPTITGGNLIVSEDGPAQTLDLTALGRDGDADDDGSSLDYAIVGVPFESGNSSNTFAGTAAINLKELDFDPGTQFDYLAENEMVDVVIAISATDQHLASGQNNTVVQVTGVNDGPEIDLGASGVSGYMNFLTDEVLPNLNNVDVTPTYVRTPIVFGNVFGTIPYPNEQFAGVAFDPVTGKVYESKGVDDYGESAVRVFDNTADFEAGTFSSTINLGSSTDIHGTYFAAYNNQLIGLSGNQVFEGPTDVAFWNATNGALIAEINPTPSVRTIQNGSGYGFEWGGNTAINLIQDGTGIYALGRSFSTWTLAEIDPVTRLVVDTDTFSLGGQGFAFAVEGLLFFGNYNTGYINRVYNIETNTLNTVDISFSFYGSNNDYWSNVSYDIGNDTLYLVNSLNAAPNGQIFKVDNVSDLVLKPSTLPSGTIVFDDLDTSDTHTASVTLPDVGPYIGSLILDTPTDAGGDTSQVNWTYNISQADFSALGAGQTITENFDVTVNDGKTGGTATQRIDITVEGIDDPAIIVGDTSGSTSEGVFPAVTGNLDHTDVDGNNANDLWTAVTNGANTFGSYNIDTAGNWSFSLANSSPAVEALDAGDMQITTFTVSTSGGTQQDVTITIAGVADAALVTGATAAGIVEDNVTNFVTGDVNHTDADANDANDLWQEITAASNTASDNGYGTVEITTAGVWTYTLDNSNATVNALQQGDPVLVDTFTVLTGDGTSRQVTINIAGANDAPTAANDVANITVDAGIDVSGPEWTEFNGHSYQFIPQNLAGGATDFGWEEARLDAIARGGHLATVTSAAENTFIHTLNGGQVGWLGGSDATTEGVWEWVVGPEAGFQFWDGGTGGTVVGGRYASWDSGQPAGLNENFLHSFGNGLWNDIADAGAPNQIMGYFLEYSGPQANGNLATNTDDPENDSITFALNAPVAGLTLFEDGAWLFDLINPTYDPLGATQSTTVVANYTATDELGAIDAGTLTLNISGINDAAVISGATAGTIAENTMSVGGDLNHTDIDGDNANDVWQAQPGLNATDMGYGTYAIDASGNWTFFLDNINATVNALNDSDTLSDSFTVQTQDGTSQVVTIAIQGTDDAPAVFGEAAVINLGQSEDPGAGWTLFEDHYYRYESNPLSWADARADALSTGGYLANITSLTESNFINALKGSNAAWLGGNDIASEGVWVWADGPEAGQQFWQGDGATGFRVGGVFENWLLPSVPDNSGAGEDFLLVSTANVWNDAGAFGGIGYLIEYSVPQIFTGDVSTNDSDPEGLGLTFSLVSPFAGLTMNTDGTWSFDQTSTTAYDTLGASQSQNYNVAYNVEDPGSNVSTGTLVLTINGENDAAVITGGTVTGTVDDAVSGDTATGNVNHTDIDLDNTDDVWLGMGPGVMSDKGYGTYGVTANGQWTYAIDNNNADVNALIVGQTLTDRFTILTEDGTPQQIIISIQGANDAAVITGTTSSTGVLVEDGPSSSVTHDLDHTDPDSNNADDLWQAVTGGATVNGLGTYDITSAGVWTYTVNDMAPAVQALAQGQTGTDQFTVFTSDGTSQLIQVSIAGANEKPVIVNDASLTLSVTESGANTAGVLTASAVMSVVDPDMTTGGLWSITSSSPSYFSQLTHNPVSGAWSYTLNENFPVNQLGVGQTLQDNFTRTYTDEFGLASDPVNLVVTINGSNDAAFVSGTVIGSVDENLGNDSISGDAFHSDVDLNNNNDVWQADSGTTTYGSFSVTGGGFWTYTLDDSTPALDTLDTGQTATDSFDILTEDGTQQTINITINGNTDAPPVVANDDSGFIETIDVLFLGAAGATLTEAGNQLNGSNTDRFNFNVSIVSADTNFTPVQWESLFASVDVVVLGGGGFNVGPTAFEEVAYAQLADNFVNDQLNVVTTGSIVQTLSAASGQVRTNLDILSPVTVPVGGTSSGSAIMLNGTVHPIVDDIATTVNLGNTVWASSVDNDPGAIALANNGNPSAGTISYVPDSGTTGRSVFIGGKYLEGGLPAGTQAPLRNGDPDFLLEQAVAWAAGVNKVNVDENTPFTFTAESLLANDTASGSAFISNVSAISTKGAAVFLSGGNVVYNPLPSSQLDQSIGNGQTTTDTFTYTIDDGGQNATATVTVTVNGITDVDSPPVLNSTEMNGFAAGNSATYRFGQFRFADDDVIPQPAVEYTVRPLSGDANPLPTGFTFDPVFVEFDLGPSATVSYREDLKLSAFEVDGQNAFFKFGYSADTNGDIRFVYSDLSPLGGPDVLEMGLDSGMALGEDTVGDGSLIDLSGVEAFAPNVLDKISVLDLRNGQENNLTLDRDDLLQLIDGNASSDVEGFVFEVDTYEIGNIAFLDDDATSGTAGWDAVAVSPDNYNLIDTTTGTAGTAGDFGVIGNVFATIFIDDGSGP